MGAVSAVGSEEGFAVVPDSVVKDPDSPVVAVIFDVIVAAELPELVIVVASVAMTIAPMLTVVASPNAVEAASIQSFATQYAAKAA